jgi:hypothetical protein
MQRYNLRFLILFVAVISLVLAITSQLRRYFILEACDALKKDGYVFSTPNEWRDVIWQRRPVVVVVFRSDNSMSIARPNWKGVEDANAELKNSKD